MSKKGKCAVCDFDCSDLKPKIILENLVLCKKHKVKLIEEVSMQCSVCGSQDTTYKTGISKSGKNAGKAWVAYDCNEPACKNDKGYPNRTFVNTPKVAQGNTKKTAYQAPSNNPISTLEKKVDQILSILKANFPEVEVTESEESPF